MTRPTSSMVGDKILLKEEEVEEIVEKWLKEWKVHVPEDNPPLQNYGNEK